MPTLSLTNFNIVCATVGGFITIFGLVSYLLKEKFYLSEALISMIAGIVFSPHATNWIRPLEYANNNEIDLETITLYFSRLVLGVQLVLTGVQLPSKYIWKERKSLSILLGPGMCCMWLSTSLLVWGLVPRIDFVMALSIGACVTPTDPVLSASIVKGKFADKNIPPPLQKIIVAESGSNDGLGYPFLFLGLYLLKYIGDGGAGEHGRYGRAFGLWFGDTWGYVIILSIVYGAVVGWIAKELLHWAEERRFVDRESFLVFAITLALFIVGTVGLIGSDDVLACFIAGNVFTWDDWFRLETMDDSLQPTIDMLLNVSVFAWYGAVCPWHSFVSNNVIPIYRLIPLGILVLLLRRLPMILAFHKGIHQVEHLKHAFFTGWFGPIGVSAIFYLYISREFLREVVFMGHEREDAEHLAEAMNVVVWFLVICSVVCHGLSVPLGKLGFFLPRTISTAISSERVSRNTSPAREGTDEPDLGPHGRAENALAREFRRRRPTSSEIGPATVSGVGITALGATISKSLKGFFGRGSNSRSLEVLSSKENTNTKNDKNDSDGSSPKGLGEGSRPQISRPTDGRVIGNVIRSSVENEDTNADDTGPSSTGGADSPVRGRAASPVANRNTQTATVPGISWQRSIRFPDEQPATPKSENAPR